MTVKLTSSFFANARGLTLKDSASVTWAINQNTNEISATSTGGGGGGVTSVALSDASTTPIYAISGSPVTTTGTLTLTLATQSANKVFAGPTTGSAAQPTFRSLVAADLPAGTTPVGANPTALVGPTATNGSAATFMRSDAAPAIDETQNYTWSGAHQFNAPAGANAADFQGVTDTYTCLFTGFSGTAGHSFGIGTAAGSNASDVCAYFKNRAATSTFFEIFGDGHGTLGASATAGLQWNSSGAFTLTPSAGVALSITGISGSDVLDITLGAAGVSHPAINVTDGTATSGWYGNGASGHIVGTTSAHKFILVAGGVSIVTLTNSGGMQIGAPTGGDKGAGTINVSGGYYINGVSLIGGASLLTTVVQTGGTSQNYTIPASNMHFICCIGGGGGGGSGGLAAAGAAVGGGGGGGGGGIAWIIVPTSALGTVGATIACTFGSTTGGTGGTAVTAAGSGNPGTAGTNATFAGWIGAAGGTNGGAGGAGSAGSAGGGATGIWVNGTAGGGGSNGSGTAGSAGTNPTSSNFFGTGTNWSCCGGGGGGGVSTGNAASNGGNGAGGGTNGAGNTTTGLLMPSGVGGTGGTTTGNGGNGTGSVGGTYGSSGGGGGGGNSTVGGTAGTGGQGGDYGGGGGGGGGGRSGSGSPHSGAGGRGGYAAVVLLAW